MQQDIPPSDPETGLGFLIAGTRRRLKQVVWTRLQPLHLTPQQYWILMVIHQKGPQSLHALAKEIWMDDPTASRLVKTLCDRGLLQTRSDPSHGRRIRISPTQEGHRLLERLEALTGELRVQLLEGVSREDQALVRLALTQIMRNLEALSEGASKAPRLKASNE